MLVYFAKEYSPIWFAPTHRQTIGKGSSAIRPYLVRKYVLCMIDRGHGKD
jgi:hypothetical protein